ncbi:hypothetical protein TpMuguga_03g00073 [Theileria parva strain Muguga]|uniref:uncharacterized protein n=1 Tax=Theileria parva strain Muguga TaxID=333668 RepID=UPI001C618B88|nr:uncharacterized protein TpMuguga_03g00073 [Theileria parva strain Muguga]EAN30809.2 hypothetical protein TpMuguga_03g00073 [Theileria parva strain Muguga]
MRISLLFIVCLFKGVLGRPGSIYGGTMLLSLLKPFWNYRRYTGMSLNPPMCRVEKTYPYKSINITTYGLMRSYTAVLTGYSMKETRTGMKANKGTLYGWNSKVKPQRNGKITFLFYSDFKMPKPVKGESAEFCCHIYSPPLNIGPSVKAALGTEADDPKRDFGSDEKLDQILRKESNTKSKKITSCCFLVHG